MKFRVLILMLYIDLFQSCTVQRDSWYSDHEACRKRGTSKSFGGTRIKWLWVGFDQRMLGANPCSASHYGRHSGTTSRQHPDDTSILINVPVSEFHTLAGRGMEWTCCLLSNTFATYRYWSTTPLLCKRTSRSYMDSIMPAIFPFVCQFVYCNILIACNTRYQISHGINSVRQTLRMQFFARASKPYWGQQQERPALGQLAASIIKLVNNAPHVATVTLRPHLTQTRADVYLHQ